MGPRDLATNFLRKARQDAVAAVRLAAQPDVADEIVGFHAQQAIEKHVKAVLVSRSVPFRRTHDLVELFDTARDAGLTLPDWLEDARSLTPYAVEYRYGAVEPDSTSLDRDATVALVQRSQEWADALVGE